MPGSVSPPRQPAGSLALPRDSVRNESSAPLHWGSRPRSQSAGRWSRQLFLGGALGCGAEVSHFPGRHGFAIRGQLLSLRQLITAEIRLRSVLALRQKGGTPPPSLLTQRPRRCCFYDSKGGAIRREPRGGYKERRVLWWEDRTANGDTPMRLPPAREPDP